MSASLKILKALSDIEQQIAEPIRAITSECGYIWEPVRNAVGCRPGEERILLDDLAKGGYLETAFRDKVLLCPFSHEIHVAFREICPSCRSADIDREEMIHHFRCGFVGPETQFARADRLVCPKCDHVLKHIGVDYERPSEIFVCHACDWTGSTPGTEGNCIGCGRLFEPEQALEARICAYSLSPKGALALQDGSLATDNEDAHVIDNQFGTLSPDVFRLMFRNLFDQAARYNRPLSLMCAHFDQFHALSSEKGLTIAAKAMRRLIDTLKDFLRTCDMVSISDHHTILVVLPETPFTGAKTLADRLLTAFRNVKIEDADIPTTITIGLVRLRPETDSWEAMLTRAVELAETGARQGGDRLLDAGMEDS